MDSKCHIYCRIEKHLIVLHSQIKETSGIQKISNFTKKKVV